MEAGGGVSLSDPIVKLVTTTAERFRAIRYERYIYRAALLKITKRSMDGRAAREEAYAALEKAQRWRDLDKPGAAG